MTANVTIKQYYRVDEVAAILSVTKRTVYRLVEEGDIEVLYLRPGSKGMRFTADAVAAYQRIIVERTAAYLGAVPATPAPSEKDAQHPQLQRPRRRVFSSGI